MKIIGICGPSGSGKTTIARILQKELNASLIELDSYFFMDPPVKKYHNREHNWELPENLDFRGLRATVNDLLKGKMSVTRYWNTTTTISSKPIAPKNYLIIEGFALFWDELLVNLMDLKIFIDVPDEVGIKRRLQRVKNPSLEKWYQEITFPEYNSRKHIYKSRTDTILDGLQPIETNVKAILQLINS